MAIATTRLERKKCPEHYSFWLTKETMDYIRRANRITKIPQGQIIQMTFEYLKLIRTQEYRKLNIDEQGRLGYLKLVFNIIPI